MKRTAAIVFALALGSAVQAQISVFSSGEGTPENLSLAPSGFGSWGGTLFTPDFRKHVIWSVSASGGPGTVFANVDPSYEDRGGVFLPDTGWGALSGQYLVAGDQFISTQNGYLGDIRAYNSSGQQTVVAANLPLIPTGPVLAPKNFGTLGGDALMGDDFSATLHVLSANGTMSKFGNNLAGDPWGLAFAPKGFGQYSGDLLFSSSRSGVVGFVDGSGNSGILRTLTTADGLLNQGLRQIAFTPKDWLAPIGIHGVDLLVSIADSNGATGTGVHGSIVAIDSRGRLVADLRKGTTSSKFDPRGMYFAADGSLIVNDASDPILRVEPTAFSKYQPVPEPISFIALATGAGLLLRRRRRV